MAAFAMAGAGMHEDCFLSFTPACDLGRLLTKHISSPTDFDLSPDDIKPRVTCGIHWELSSVIDLTVDGLPSWLEVAAWLKEDFEKINDAGNETLCQAFGRAARNSGINGMFCPSARVPNGINLVVFRDRLRKSRFNANSWARKNCTNI